MAEVTLGDNGTCWWGKKCTDTVENTTGVSIKDPTGSVPKGSQPSIEILLEMKAAAVAAEDYDEAKRLKEEINSLQVKHSATERNRDGKKAKKERSLKEENPREDISGTKRKKNGITLHVEDEDDGTEQGVKCAKKTKYEKTLKQIQNRRD